MGQQLWQWFLEPANQKLFWGLIIVFAIGFTVGRLTRHQEKKTLKSRTREGDEAFFKGIQYILSNDRDQAIEAFTKSVQVNSDTIETYVALGNLYRSKGDIDRAIRIRQSLILRSNIDEQIKLRALFDLGLDYRKGGFLNRALETFLQVIQKRPNDLETLAELEKIYEEMKDWNNAFSVRQKIARLSKDDHGHILAHHQTELGKVYLEKGDVSKAKACFKKAISINETCIDAYLHLGDLHFSRQEYTGAIETWKSVVNVAPQFTFLAYRRLEAAYEKMENLKPVEVFLRECAKLNSDAFTHMALARYLYNAEDYDGALGELKSALELDPAFWEARKYMGEILLALDKKEEALLSYRDLIPNLKVPYLKFQCNQCGFKPSELQWQCPQCRNWDTIELVDSKTIDTKTTNAHQALQKPVAIDQRQSQEGEA